MNADDLKTGVEYATLGSISILVAGFLQSMEFMTNYKGILPLPFPFYVIAGILFLLTCGAHLFYWFGEKSGPKVLNPIAFFSFGFGILLFFIAAILTLIIYLITSYKT